jgi:hypothetical protein
MRNDTGTRAKRNPERSRPQGVSAITAYDSPGPRRHRSRPPHRPPMHPLHRRRTAVDASAEKGHISGKRRTSVGSATSNSASSTIAGRGSRSAFFGGSRFARDWRVLIRFDHTKERMHAHCRVDGTEPPVLGEFDLHHDVQIPLLVGALERRHTLIANDDGLPRFDDRALWALDVDTAAYDIRQHPPPQETIWTDRQGA